MTLCTDTPMTVCRYTDDRWLYVQIHRYTDDPWLYVHWWLCTVTVHRWPMIHQWLSGQYSWTMMVPSMVHSQFMDNLRPFLCTSERWLPFGCIRKWVHNVAALLCDVHTNNCVIINGEKCQFFSWFTAATAIRRLGRIFQFSNQRKGSSSFYYLFFYSKLLAKVLMYSE